MFETVLIAIAVIGALAVLTFGWWLPVGKG